MTKTSVQSVSIPKSKIVEMGGQQIEVKTLPVGKYLEIIANLEALPSVAMQMVAASSSGSDDIAKFIVAAMQVAQKEFFDIVSIASGLEAEFILDNVALHELIEFVEVLSEVNRLPEIVGKLRAAAAKLLPAA